MLGCPRTALGLVWSILLAGSPLWAQEAATVTGQVRGAGLPLQGVAVALPDLKLATFTGTDGRFTLIVPGGRFRPGQQARLTVELLGYEPGAARVVLVPGTVERSFTLALDPLRLAEIVATGAGTRTQALKLATARASVDSSVLRDAGQVNVLQALAGRVAGAVTMQQGGEPGASTAMVIRGPKTLAPLGGTGQPLLVVDGVPMINDTRATGTGALLGGASLNRGADLDPEDIESIEVLRGPAAASVYGASAGTGGVLLIRTRRGHPGPTTFTFNTSATLERPARFLPTQRQWGLGTGGVSTACAAPDCFVQTGVGSWGPLLPAGTPTYDHGREIYTTGHLLDNTLSVSGGDDRSTFYLSLGGTGQNGFIVGDNDAYHRYSVRVNATRALSSSLTVGGSASLVQTTASYVMRGNSSTSMLLGALRTPPEFDNQPYLDLTSGLQRSYRRPFPTLTSSTLTRGIDNPFFVINQDESSSSVGRVLGNVNARWSVRPWLSMDYTLGADQANDDRTRGYALSSSAAPTGSVEREQLYDRIIDQTLVATAVRTLARGLDGTLTLAQNLRQTDFRVLDLLGRQLIAPQPFNLSNTSTRDQPLDRSSRVRMAGYLAQGSLALRDELFFSTGVRRDASSTFAPGNQGAWYPRASASWVFSRQPVVPSWLSFGKLRIAYGQSGQQPQPYLLRDIYADPSAPFTDAGGAIQVPSSGGFGGLYTAPTRGNPDLHPERNSELETGADLTFFGGRADASLTYYLQDARGLVMNVPQAPSTGAGSIVENAGRVTNKGVEASVNLRPFRGGHIGLDVGVTFARNRNRVVSLGPGQAQFVPFWDGIGTLSTVAQVGYPLGVFRGVDFVRCGHGIATVGAENVQAACANAPAGALYLGADGFPISEAPTTRVIGDPNPDWTGGLSVALRVSGVRITAFLEHRQGGVTWDGTRASMIQYGTHADTEIRGQQRTFGKDYFPGPVVGPGADKAVTLDEGWFAGGNGAAGLGGFNGPSSQFLEDATFSRLRELSVAGTLRPRRLRALGLTSVDARASLQNLVTWTRYEGFDPEPSLGGAVLGNRGIDWFGNPLSRGLQLSLTLHR